MMKKLMITKRLMLVCIMCMSFNIARCQYIKPEEHKIITTDRSDGRYISTRGMVQDRLRHLIPELKFNPDFTKAEFLDWQLKVRAKLRELMYFPEVHTQPKPKLISTTKKDGYTVEKWEMYPFSGYVVPFLVLVPDNATPDHPVPGVLSFPGSWHSKEYTAGQPEINEKFAARPEFAKFNDQALEYCKAGYVSIILDNPGCAETSDLEKYGLGTGYNRESFTRYLLDMGWSYVGLASFNGSLVVNWMKTNKLINKDQIMVSGLSLGTEYAMVVAVLDPDVKALVFNDQLTRVVERTISLTKPSGKGWRPTVNPLWHCVPGMWAQFDFPDLLAAVAPRHLVITEGGLTNDLKFIGDAYSIMGAEDNYTYYYYDKYKNPASRKDTLATPPEGLSVMEFWDYANIDPKHHYFKGYLAVPWMKEVVKDLNENK